MKIKNTAVRLISINTAQILKYAKIEDPETGEISDGKVIGATPGQSIKLMPAGKAVDVPDNVCIKYAKYLRALYAANDIAFKMSILDKLTDAKTVDPDEDEDLVDEEVAGEGEDEDLVETTISKYAGMPRNDLKEMAEAMNIKVTSSMTIAKIIDALEATEET